MTGAKAAALAEVTGAAERYDDPAKRRFVSADVFVRARRGQMSGLTLWSGHHPLVALAAPGDTPAPGAIGYYSDGDQRAAAVTLSAFGRRLFLEFGPDDVLATNVLSYLLARPR